MYIGLLLWSPVQHQDANYDDNQGASDDGKQSYYARQDCRRDTSMRDTWGGGGGKREGEGERETEG